MELAGHKGALTKPFVSMQGPARPAASTAPGGGPGGPPATHPAAPAATEPLVRLGPPHHPLLVLRTSPPPPILPVNPLLMPDPV